MLLSGKHIKLRALEPTDLETLYVWENDTLNWQVSGTLIPFSRFILEQYLASAHNDIYTTKQLRLMIELPPMKNVRKVAKSIGCIDLFDFDPKNKRAGIGILIGDSSERNKGYASEALKLLLNYAIKSLDLHQLYANIIVNNHVSINLFKRHHFEITGLKHDWLLVNGKWMDEYILQHIVSPMDEFPNEGEANQYQ